MDPNRTNYNGDTYIHRCYSLEIADLLIKSGTDIIKQNKQGEIPLHYTRSSKIAKILLNYNSFTDLNKKKSSFYYID